jgi:signal transduction histidine kinase/ActR/RegA family two-component response regulator
MDTKDRYGSRPPHDASEEIERFADKGDSTETIDLNGMLSGAVTDSGSFDLRWVRQAAFGRLLDVMPVPAFIINQDRTIAFANRACGVISEAYRELTGNPFSMLFPNKVQAERAGGELTKVFMEGAPQVFEGFFCIAGAKLWGRMHVRSIRVKERKFAMGLIEDLTAEMKRALLNEKYKQLVNLLPLGIAEFAPAAPIRIDEPESHVIDQILKAVVIDGNDEFARIHGLGAIEEVFGRPLSETLPFEGRNRTLYTKWIRSGFPISAAEAVQESPEGGEQYVENTLIGLLQRGRLAGFWLLKRDVTTSHKMKEDAFRAQKLESLGLLAGGIAHDFNNILTAILGNINLAKISAGSNEKVTQRLAEAEKGSWRARDLTEQLLTFSKGGAPKKKAHSIGPVLRESVAFALRGSNVVFDLSVPDDLWPVEIDEGQISQVINNLVINADQAMPDGGLLKVTAHNATINRKHNLPIQDGKYVVIGIEDQGTGIAPEHVSRIFDPYFTTKRQGSGLGLATSYSIIRNHDGCVRVESELAKGSTFYVYLPASEKDVRPQEKNCGVEKRMSGKILIMDDEQMVRDVASEMLSHMGHRVVCATNGREALHYYGDALKANTPFDAVIIDLTVPGSMGGLETLKELLKMDPCVKAIVSSGYSNNPVMSQFSRYGFKGVVTKPYNFDELNAVLARVMNPDS